MKYLILCALALALCFSVGCTDANVVSHNLSEAAEQFEINRRVVFYNGITGEYMLVIEGRCSIKYDSMDKQLEVVVKTGEDEFKKHFLGLSDNVTYFAEQIDSAEASAYHYRVVFKPSVIVPNIDIE